MSNVETRKLSTLSIPARVLAAVINTTEYGCMRAQKRSIAKLSGLTEDELSIGIAELMHHALLTRYRDSQTRYQYLVLHPNLCSNKSVFSSVYFSSFGGVYSKRDRLSATKAIKKLNNT